MDPEDFRILSHLIRDAREPFESIGKAVGLSGNAVKARVARMHDEGVLRGFVATPDPALFGYRMALFAFTHVEDLGKREKELLEAAPSLGAVRWVDVTLDDSVLIAALVKDDADVDRIERAASNLVGKGPEWSCRCGGAPEASTDVTLLDWRIIRALRADGRKTLKDVVDETGVSFKTVKKRLDRLLAHDALWISPSISTSEASGLVLFDLFVELDDAKRRGEVTKLLPKDAVAFPVDWPEPGLMVHAYRANLREVQDDLKRVRSAPGVKEATMKIATRHVYDTWLDQKIDEIISRLSAERRLPAKAKVEERAPARS